MKQQDYSTEIEVVVTTVITLIAINASESHAFTSLLRKTKKLNIVIQLFYTVFVFFILFMLEGLIGMFIQMVFSNLVKLICFAFFTYMSFISLFYSITMNNFKSIRRVVYESKFSKYQSNNCNDFSFSVSQDDVTLNEEDDEIEEVDEDLEGNEVCKEVFDGLNKLESDNQNYNEPDNLKSHDKKNSLDNEYNEMNNYTLKTANNNNVNNENTNLNQSNNININNNKKLKTHFKHNADPIKTTDENEIISKEQMEKTNTSIINTDNSLSNNKKIFVGDKNSSNEDLKKNSLKNINLNKQYNASNIIQSNKIVKNTNNTNKKRLLQSKNQSNKKTGAFPHEIRELSHVGFDSSFEDESEESIYEFLFVLTEFIVRSEFSNHNFYMFCVLSILIDKSVFLFSSISTVFVFMSLVLFSEGKIDAISFKKVKVIIYGFSMIICASYAYNKDFPKAYH